IVEVEHMAHLAVGKRRIEQPELEVSADHGCLRPTADLPQHAEKRVNALVPAPGQRATDPVEDAAPGFALRCRRKIKKPCCSEMPTKRLGQGRSVGIEILVHCQRSGVIGRKSEVETSL